MKQMKSKKGAMVKVIFVLIVALVGGLIAFTAMGMVTGAFEETENIGCDMFCEMHAEPEGYGTIHRIPTITFVGAGIYLGGFGTAGSAFFGGLSGGIIGGAGPSWSEIFWDDMRELRQNMVDPESMGCYCDVEETRGRYIHVQGDTDRIDEFHLTDDNPPVHLRKRVDVFDHRGAADSCISIFEEDGQEFDPPVHGVADIDRIEHCMIFSEDGDDGCAIWLFEQGFVMDDGDMTIWEQAEAQGKDVGFYTNERSIHDDPVYSLVPGDEVDMGGDHYSQRMLLLNFAEGEDRRFNFQAPIVCGAELRDQESIEDRMDYACRNYCRDQDKFFFGSTCSAMHMDGYDELPQEYVDEYEGEVSFCSPGERSYCLCEHHIELLWHVDYNYNEGLERIFNPTPHDGATGVPVDTEISFYLDLESPPGEVEVESTSLEFGDFETTVQESGEVELDEDWHDGTNLEGGKEYTWEVKLEEGDGTVLRRMFTFTTEQ